MWKLQLTIITIFLNSIILLLYINPQNLAISGQKRSSDLGIRSHGVVLGVQITIVPASVGRVSDLTKFIVSGDVVDADLQKSVTRL